MENQTLIMVITSLASIVLGVVLGGTSVFIAYGRAIKSILESPVLMTSLEELAKSWPAPIREAVADTGRFLEEVADDKPSAAPAVISPVTLMPLPPDVGPVG